LWRHKILVGAVVAAGLVGNTAYQAIAPPVYTASALVMLGPSVNVQTQTLVVTSYPVLEAAMNDARVGDVPLATLQERVRAIRAGAQMITIAAQASSASQAEATANSVSRSYVAYVTSARNPLGEQAAEFLQPATTATVKPLVTRLSEAAGLGFLAGLLLCLIAGLAVWRNDRWLTERDAMADSIGVPVLASVRASAPKDSSGWAKLMESYSPDTGDGWRLGGLLRELGVTSDALGRFRGGDTVSLAILSLSTDRDALAIGPQLASFADARGIPTALVAERGQEAELTTRAPRALIAAGAARAGTGLRAVYRAAASGQGPRKPRIVMFDPDRPGQLPADTLTIAVAVVDGKNPRVTGVISAAQTVLAVTAGAVTGEQLTRVAASAAGAGHKLTGILVANPDPDDQTTGRSPQLARPEQDRMPTRMYGVATGSRR
jgi:capsular polysaccharide biosynthesis protein